MRATSASSSASSTSSSPTRTRRSSRVSGLNSLRIPFNYRHFEDDDAPLDDQGGRASACSTASSTHAAHHGIYTILDLHAVPGAQNQHWHSDNPTQWASFWSHRQFPGSGRAPVGGDRRPIPTQPLGRGIQPDERTGGCRGQHDRALLPPPRGGDPRGRSRPHPVPRRQQVLDAVRSARRPASRTPSTRRTTTRCRASSTAVPIPASAAEEFVDRDTDRGDVPRPYGSYMRETGTPIWVGEFGPVYTGDPARDEQRFRLLEDQLEIYARHEASWALWTYKDIGLQGVVTTDPGSAYMRRIAPVLEKKARLGVDAWGATDAGVRHLIEPIEQLFEEEFPDFSPYPWSAPRWIAGHIRHVMLAEAMVDDFARAFDGVSSRRRGVARRRVLLPQLRHPRPPRRHPAAGDVASASRGDGREGGVARARAVARVSGGPNSVRQHVRLSSRLRAGVESTHGISQPRCQRSQGLRPLDGDDDVRGRRQVRRRRRHRPRRGEAPARHRARGRGQPDRHGRRLLERRLRGDRRQGRRRQAR